MKMRLYTLQLQVKAPIETGSNEIESAVNAALDEPPCDWEDWTLGYASVTGITVVDDDEEE